ncbi:hypothetical protein [Sphingomonas aracearum]|uniref:Uncharacterized protein n=1 Tax=Sphingomonas aracearum TaxID=2283317 RepID=A0A369VWN4_9SPHN|nr:hypothetical protein [Sphingomonas aracearum]RDE06796.1 hypothetical protein DVW87_03680 [Sphingomonas aracearum]
MIPESTNFDLEGIGLTLDDLDLADDDLPPLPLDRPRYQPKGWWTPTPLEDFHLDLPDFADGAERTRYMVTQMARAVTADDDAPVHPYAGRLVSLNELLDALEAPTIRLLNE